MTFALPEPLPPERRRPARIGSAARTYAGLLRDRTFVGYALASGFLFAALFAYISGSSFVLQGVYDLNPQEYSLVFGLNAIGMVIVSQVNGRIVGRFTERTLLRAGLIASTTGAAGMLLAAGLQLGLAALLPPLSLLVASIGLIMPNATSLALSKQKKTAGSASALLGVLQFVVGGLAAPLVGLFSNDSALPMTTIMAGFAVLSLLAFTCLTRDTRLLPAAA